MAVLMTALAHPIGSPGARMALQFVQGLYSSTMISPWVWCLGKGGNLTGSLSTAETDPEGISGADCHSTPCSLSISSFLEVEAGNHYALCIHLSLQGC